jgi:tripartite-type tricarboxylate transporter receptor subunit TctC
MHQSRRAILILAGALLTLNAGAQQDVFPKGPIQLIVPFPPGGAVDIVGRKIAEKFKEYMGESVVVVNRPGANGVVAWKSLLSTPADGHHLFAAAGQGLGFVHRMNASLSVPFMNDFIPVASYANYPVVILVNKDLPVTNLRELAALAAKDPKALSYGTTGVGSGGHFLFELYKSQARLPDDALPPIHYGGIAPELTALVGNHIQVAIMPLTSLAAQQIDSGAIRALAVSSDQRSPFRREIQTVVEQGFPDLVAKDHLSYWVLAKTPPATVAKLADATRRASQDPEIRKLLADMFLEVEYLDGPATRKQFETRATQFEPLIKKLNIKLQ